MTTVDLNYKVLGEGKSVIILHGLFGSLDNWMSLAKSWSKNYKVFLIDQRNHGKSPHTDQFSYSLMAEDLRDFMEKHEIEKPIVLGHSMGGKTAMEFAVKYPDLLEKLIVVDIAPVSYPVHHDHIIEAMESLDLENIESRKMADRQLSRQIKEMGIRQFLLKNLYLKEKQQYDWKFNLKVIKREIEAIGEWAISEGVFEGKVLFIKGEKSDYIKAEYALQIAEKFPNYDLTEIEGAGHWVHAEAKEDFSQEVLTFMKE